MPCIPPTSIPTPPPAVYRRAQLVYLLEGSHAAPFAYQLTHVNQLLYHRQPVCRRMTLPMIAAGGITPRLPSNRIPTRPPKSVDVPI